MNMKNKIELAILAIIIMAFCFVSGYADGRWLGEARGYQEGYDRAMAIVDDYPQATFGGFMVTTENGATVMFDSLTVIGEQRILDAVSDYPNMVKVVDNQKEFSVGFGTMTTISKTNEIEDDTAK